MRNQLSTPLTLFYKVGLLSLFAVVGLFLFASSLGYQWNPRAASDPMTIPARVLCAVAGMGSLYWIRNCARLRQVEMDDTFLYVSNYRTEVQIQLSEITAWRETGSYWFTIIVTLKSNSSCGREIVFRPRHRFYLSGLHPITRQLAEHAKQARREAAGCGQNDANSKPPATAIRNNLMA